MAEADVASFEDFKGKDYSFLVAWFRLTFERLRYFRVLWAKTAPTDVRVLWSLITLLDLDFRSIIEGTKSWNGNLVIYTVSSPLSKISGPYFKLTYPRVSRWLPMFQDTRHFMSPETRQKVSGRSRKGPQAINETRSMWQFSCFTFKIRKITSLH